LVETFWVEDRIAEEVCGDVLVVETDDEADLDEVAESLHVPNAGLQPLPQYALDFPQCPYLLQQFPKAEFKQVCPLVPAQLPSVETFFAAPPLFDAVQVPWPDWQPSAQYADVLPLIKRCNSSGEQLEVRLYQ
jgi:hypothetical protein